jgi:hypothetical protein
MNQQRTLFDDPHARFEMFHADNPQVYAKLVELSRTAKRAGHERLGIRTLWERLRWFFKIEVRSDDDFKLNDHYTSYYSRLIMQREPDLAGFFEIRERTH